MLPNSPLQMHRRANEAPAERKKYMHEMHEAMQNELRAGESREGMDLTESLSGRRKHRRRISQRLRQNIVGQEAALADCEIIDSAFVLILAAHETSVSTIHFSLLLSATRPSS